MTQFNDHLYDLLETYAQSGVHTEYMGEDTALVIDTEISGNLKWENDFSRIYFTVSKGKINTTLDELRNQLLPTGYYPFISKYDKEKKFRTPEELSVIKFENQFDVLEFRYTHGIEFGITHEEVVEKIKDFDRRFGIEIYGASENWALIRFKKLPEDLTALVEEIIAFSPETLAYVERRFKKWTEKEQRKFLYSQIGYQKFTDFLWVKSS